MKRALTLNSNSFHFFLSLSDTCQSFDESMRNEERPRIIFPTLLTYLPYRQILILHEPPRIDRWPRVHECADEREHDRYDLESIFNQFYKLHGLLISCFLAYLTFSALSGYFSTKNTQFSIIRPTVALQQHIRDVHMTKTIGL